MLSCYRAAAKLRQRKATFRDHTRSIAFEPSDGIRFGNDVLPSAISGKRLYITGLVRAIYQIERIRRVRGASNWGTLFAFCIGGLDDTDGGWNL
jgi:hypothetical protein